MAIYGADPEQLAQLGRTLNQQIDVITQMMSTVESTFAGTVWHGPARQRFEQEWNQSFRQALADSTRPSAPPAATVSRDRASCIA